MHVVCCYLLTVVAVGTVYLDPYMDPLLGLLLAIGLTAVDPENAVGARLSLAK